ncbi:MAG: stalk domain-containing protein [Armatimonadota bacterium]|nr:stalk domain-containing protein [Armatimonadota bacterium]
MVLHQRRKLNRAGSIFAAALLMCGLAMNVGSAQGSWRIYLDEADITGPAAPITHWDAPAINVSALGSALGLDISINGNELLLIDSHGTEWRARGGDNSLNSAGRTLFLDHPALILATAAYIPINAIAEIAGLQLKVDRDTRRADLRSLRNEPPALADGWQTLTIKKSPQEISAETTVHTGPGASRDIKQYLPPNHDSLRFSLGLGYVQGADWATELTASGGLRGVHLDFGTFLTMGQRGLRPSSGRLSLVDEEFGWGVEAGDLFSDLWGLERGARYSWRAAENRWPSLSVYLKNARSGSHDMLLTYRDEIALNPNLSVGGEVATNGSLLLKGRFEKDRLRLYGYHRSTSGSSTGGTGLFASYDIGRGISLYGGISRSGRGEKRQDWRSLSVRLPLSPGVDLTLEHTLTETGATANDASAAMLTLPVGPVRVLVRHQWRKSERPAFGTTLDWIGSNSRELMASAAYFANPRVSFDFQVSTRWQDGIYSGRWEQLVSTWRLSPRTQFQTISGFPNMLEPGRLRLRLSQDLQQDFSLNVEYGRLSPFQGVGISPGERGFMIMLRKQWGVATPARGGEVSGRVVDLLNQPIPNAVVQLGAYRTVADEGGRYLFRHVPRGTYEICLDNENLPADYKGDETPRLIDITSASREQIDLRAVPLNTITGRAYCDQNGDGKYDPDEGVAGIVIHVAGFATVTGSDGSFSFYNLEPGSHTISLDTDRLLAGFVPASPVEITVDLLPDRPMSGITFRLLKREKEIVFQELQ